MAANAYVGACTCQANGLDEKSPPNEHSAFDRAEIVKNLLVARLGGAEHIDWNRGSFDRFEKTVDGNWQTTGQLSFDIRYVGGKRVRRPDLQFTIIGINSDAQQDHSTLPVVQIELRERVDADWQRTGYVNVLARDVLRPETCTVRLRGGRTMQLDDYIFN
ncbi:MAG: hypothetical protein AB7G06_03550 [Bdellovibrionales bacterium]